MSLVVLSGVDFTGMNLLVLSGLLVISMNVFGSFIWCDCYWY